MNTVEGQSAADMELKKKQTYQILGAFATGILVGALFGILFYHLGTKNK